jgi:NADH-quinone oxidoreductase subunit G
MVKQGGAWKEVDWNVALDYTSHALRDVAKTHGGAEIGALVSPHATLEEMYLAQKLMRGIGSENIDFRLRQTDFSADGKRRGSPWLGMKIAEVSRLDRVLVVGSFLRKDHPLIAQRLRQSAKKGAQISVIHSADDDLLIKLTARLIAVPSQLPSLLAQVLTAVSEMKGAPVAAEFAAVSVTDDATRIAQSLVSGSHVGILLGNFAQQHAQAATLHALGQQLAAVLGGTLGFLGEAANSVGGYAAKAIPGAGGLNAAAMLKDARKAYVILGADAELDTVDGAQTLDALGDAASVILLTPFKSKAALAYADVLLPVSPFTETSGTFVNSEGRVQSFYAAVKPRGDTRPAWKVLRVLGNLLNVSGFDFGSSEEVRAEALGGNPQFVGGLDNGIDAVAIEFPASGNALERIADVPIHFADPLSRRAPSLQAALDSAAPAARMNAATLARIGATDGDRVKVDAGGTAKVVLSVLLDAAVPVGAVRIAAAHPLTAALPMVASLTVEKA